MSRKNKSARGRRMRKIRSDLILIVVLALVLFGGNKLAGVGKALGQSIKEFKKEVKEDVPAEAAEKKDE